MNRYSLTNEGRARFRKIKIDTNSDEAKMEGYEILDYLFEIGAGTVEEIEKYTGMSWSQVNEKLWAFMAWGYVEKTAEPEQ